MKNSERITIMATVDGVVRPVELVGYQQFQMAKDAIVCADDKSYALFVMGCMQEDGIMTEQEAKALEDPDKMADICGDFRAERDEEFDTNAFGDMASILAKYAEAIREA